MEKFSLAALARQREQSPAHLASEQLIEELGGRGCHQTDIGDAFYEADPEWLIRE
jgi:hypothetical protein